MFLSVIPSGPCYLPGMARTLQNRLSWSKSRDRMFQECPRKYYYQYYGAWGGWERTADPRTRELYVLKNLETRHIWAGDKVHKAVSQVLETIRNGMPVPPAEGLVRRTVESMRADFRDSKAGLFWEQPKHKRGFFEHAYDLQLDDEKWKEVADHVELCIRTFLDSGILKAIQTVPAEDWLEVEELKTFELNGVQVYVQLDFACRREPGIVIYDWKSGRSHRDEETSLQFACYALYAMETWNVDAGNVCATEFNLARNEVKEHTVTEDVVQHVRHYVLESIGEMQGLLDDLEKNQASEETFPLADDAQVCKYCNFRKVCPRFA